MDSRSRNKLEQTYRNEKSRLIDRLRAAGKTLEDAEDIVHDVYAETMSRVSLIAGIRNLPAWINSLLTRRAIDAWRRDRVRVASGEVNLAEDTLREILAGADLDPIEYFVRENVVDVLNDAAGDSGEFQKPSSKKRRYIDFRDWWEDRGLIQKTLVVCGFILLGVGALGLFGLVLMLLWNWLMPDIFGLKEISYWQAWGLFLLSTLLFKGMGSDDSHRPSDRRRRKRLKRYMQETGSDAGTGL